MPTTGTLTISVRILSFNFSKLKTIHIERELSEEMARDFFVMFKADNPHIQGLVAKWETRRVVFM